MAMLAASRYHTSGYRTFAVLLLLAVAAYGAVESGPASAAPAAGCPVTIAGTSQVVRAKGEPRLATLSFTSPDPSERHVLRIDNGGVNGAMRPVTSASVSSTSACCSPRSLQSTNPNSRAADQGAGSEPA